MGFFHSLKVFLMKAIFFSAATAIALAFTPASALAEISVPAGQYQFDPTHSSIAFQYDHLGFSTSFGLVRDVEGSIDLDPAALQNASVKADFTVANIVTLTAGLDSHLRGPDFFNSPDGSQKASFRSTAVEVNGDGKSAKVTGQLTLNNITREVVLDTVLRKAAEHPMRKAPSVGFDATTMIKRSDFGLGALVPVVGDDVRIRISVEANQAK